MKRKREADIESDNLHSIAEAILDLNMMRNGFIKKEDWPKLTDAAAGLAMAQIFIADSPSVTVKQIMDKAKRFKKENGELGLLAIGCIQLTSSGNADKTRQITSDIYKLLKAATKELNVPVIAF